MEVSMVRTQIQLDEALFEALREKAHRERRSMSAVIRQALREDLRVGVAPNTLPPSHYTFVSSGASGRKDISTRHDEALAEDFR
jgi:hypothetical protein